MSPCILWMCAASCRVWQPGAELRSQLRWWRRLDIPCLRMFDSVIEISLTCPSLVSLAFVNWLYSLLWLLRKP